MMWLVVERVEHHPSIAARADEPLALQQPQLVRHGRLGQPEDGRQVAHAQFAVRQRVENADARGVAERAEGVGQPLDGRRRHQRRADLPHPREVDLDEVADFIRYVHMSNWSYVKGAPGGLSSEVLRSEAEVLRS